MLLLREPYLRMYLNHQNRIMVDGEAFDAQVRRRAKNVEALLGQSVEERLEDNTACDHCQREVGKFVSCVMMHGENHCCNCH